MPTLPLEIDRNNTKCITELTEEFPFAEQPRGVKMPLRQHQLTLIYRCQQLEKKNVKVFQNEGGEKRLTMDITTCYGLICDQTGAGKSFDTLGLIASDEDPVCSTEDIKSLCDNKVLVKDYLSSPPSSLKTNLIIIPSQLSYQWEVYCENFLPSRMKHVVLTNKRYMCLVGSVEKISRYDVVIMTSNFYKHFVTMCQNTQGGEMDRLTYKRIFVDECDTTAVPKLYNALFYWYITASINNVLSPYGNFQKRIEGMRYTGPIKTDFVQMTSCSAINACIFMVRNSSEFINKSYQIPEMIVETKICKTPLSIKILKGIVDKKVLESLNANDYETAIGFYGVKQCATENTIVQMFIDKLQNNIKNINNEIDFRTQGGYIYENDEERETFEKDMDKRKKRYEQQIIHIEERIKSRNECLICFDTLFKKTIVNCCSNPFCFKCINVWLSKSNQCPMCKTSLTKESIFIVNEQNEHKLEPKPQTEFTKVENFINIMQTIGQRRKVLLFSKFHINKDLRTWLDTNNIKYAEPKGNRYVVDNIIHAYKHSRLDILLLNPMHFGSGLNLENTTDIVMMHKMEKEMETQIIGRAQRYGRTTPLRVWYLLHENETEVSNSSNF